MTDDTIWFKIRSSKVEIKSVDEIEASNNIESKGREPETSLTPTDNWINWEFSALHQFIKQEYMSTLNRAKHSLNNRKNLLVSTAWF